VLGHQHDLRSIARIDLSHDVADVHLDGAFAHAELESDRFVLLALLQDFEHWQLTRREIDYAPFCAYRSRRQRLLGSQRSGKNARWDIGSTLLNQSNRPDRLWN